MTEAEVALHTANAFIQDIVDTFNQHGNSPDFPRYAAELLNTVALAAKQIAFAEKTDPNATLTIETNDDTERTFTIAELKATTVLYEGMIYTQADQPKKAIPILEKAIKIDPQNAHAWFWLGQANLSLLNKRDAIRAFQKAIEIVPDFVDAHKQLARAQTVSGSQVAYDRTAKAANKGFNLATVFFLLCTLGLLWMFGYGVYLFSTPVSTGKFLQGTPSGQQIGEALIFMIGSVCLWLFVVAPIWMVMNKVKDWIS